MKFIEFSSLFDIMKAFPTEQSCIDYFEKLRWQGNVKSPFDPQSKIYKCANNRYKCSKTNKYFNVKTGSIFQDSKLSLQKWIMAIYIFTSHKKGISSYQLAKDISITQPNAWFMLHRLRKAMTQGDLFSTRLQGTVEVDETLIGGKESNKHREFGNKIDDFSKKADPKEIVVGGIERNGRAVIKQPLRNE